MKKRVFSVLLITFLLLCLGGCSKGKDSYFRITFFDVGQGDAALVECDGQCMLIDGGDLSAGKTIYNALEDRGIRQLDYLVVSHLHQDHYGGLIDGLKNISTIGLTLSNKRTSSKNYFAQFEEELGKVRGKGSTITIPHMDDVYKLGSAEVTVVDVSSEEENDSLVLLITYQKTRFLFTGDIQYAGQKRLVEKYAKGGDAQFKVDVLKMPHHGSWGQLFTNNNDLYRLINTFTPDYVVISVGSGNIYGHPHRETIDLLNQACDNGVVKSVYRTDQNGDILVQSDGRTVNIRPEK